MKNLIISKLLKTLINSLIAGIIFAIVGAMYIYFDNYIGMFSLGIGFILCLLYAYDAYLIKLPYVFDNNPIYFLETIVSLIGNILGAMLIGGILHLTPFYNNDILNVFRDNYVNLNHFEILFYGFINGILIYFGVNTYKKAEQPIARFLVLILCIIGCGAFLNVNIGFASFLFTAKFEGRLWSKFFTILLGNSLGLLLVPLLRKLRGKING